MSALIVGPLTVPVASASPPVRTRDEGVDRARTVDGTMCVTMYYSARRRNWLVVTAPMLRSDANALEAVLDGNPPVNCSGDILGGTVMCFPEINDWRSVMVRGGHRVVLSFTLHES